MIKDEDKEMLIKEFRKEMLKMEKENLAQLNKKTDSNMVDDLKSKFERMIKEYEDKEGNN